MNVVHVWNTLSMQRFGLQRSGSRSSGAQSDVFRNGGMQCLLNGLLPQEGGPEVCWRRHCRQGHVPRPYGYPPEQPAHQVRSCCKDSWLARGWFCRWCGRDELTGFYNTHRGIYGSCHPFVAGSLGSWCACGFKFPERWLYFNWTSCGSCWMVMTQQLIRFFAKWIGPWSEAQD